MDNEIAQPQDTPGEIKSAQCLHDYNDVDAMPSPVGSWRRGRRSGSQRDKIALVLAGGGLTGAFYEIGALRAMDDLLVDLSTGDFDIYVGTSSGSFVNALIVNGFTPHEIMRAIDNRHPELRGVHAADVLDLNLEGIWRRTLRLPRALGRICRHVLTRWREIAISDIMWELADILPSGLYNGSALDRYVRSILVEKGRSNEFDELSKELYVVATMLDSGERAVFGTGLTPDVPISTAVAASSAVPFLYRPVEVNQCDYVDGALHGAASLDLAIEAGAKLVVCVNPMVPLDTSQYHPSEHFIRQRGLQAIINQTVRTFLHSSVRYHIKNLRAKYPDVDIILIQPHWNDYDMFSYNPMHYRSRLSVAEHGFESVTRGLLENYDYFSNVLSRHNIRIAKDRVTKELGELEASGRAPEVVEQILTGEAQLGASLGSGSPLDADGQESSLGQAISQLETSLQHLKAAGNRA